MTKNLSITYTEITFEAAHRVNGISPLHGHTFVCRISYTGTTHPDFGWAVNLYDVKRLFKDNVLKAIHVADENGDGEGEGNLEDIPEIGIQSIENITRWIWNIMEPLHPGLVSVELNRGFRGSIEGHIYFGPNDYDPMARISS